MGFLEGGQEGLIVGPEDYFVSGFHPDEQGSACLVFFCFYAGNTAGTSEFLYQSVKAFHGFPLLCDGVREDLIVLGTGNRSSETAGFVILIRYLLETSLLS